VSAARALSAALAVTVLTAFTWPASPADGSPEPRERREPQWALTALDAREAWRTTRGAGVTVAVLDTGVDPSHPDLAGAVVEGPDLTGTARRRSLWGRHGTAMASVIAGRGHGDGRSPGVMGIAPAATVLSVRVALENDDPRRGRDRERGEDALARGIRYAADRGAQVISMSLGGGGGSWKGSAAEERAVRYALGRGAVLVASSGNDGAGPNRQNFPAAYPGVIAVGAVDERLRVTPFSNRQAYLSVVAPGSGILTADGPDSYVVGDGTSSAAALAAGVAALVRAAFPELAPAEVRRAIERGTVHAPADGHDPAYGHGVVNAARALEEASGFRRRPLRASAPQWTPPGRLVDALLSRRAVCVLLVLLVLALTVRRLTRHHRGGASGFPGPW
jgi:type VII secretion-associated serine protease mycosin